jgi:isoleucyl-tRNA synthetase
MNEKDLKQNPAAQTSQPIKSKISETEEIILEYWNKNDIFKKSLNKPSPKGEFVFYDGPPFATGEPHYGHVVPGTVKDIIPRYKTMQGYHVRRRWGWDCHGLPVENLIEKELKLASKKDIVDYGIGKFNAAAQKSVMRYADDWRRIIPRLGRWVDMENDYRTMDATYTESVWWAFSELYRKGLVYEGFKSMNLCPRCETTLSNFEVSQGYKDITDISVYVKFKMVGEDNTFLLAWTTTPWTLPGNVALAINPTIKYVKIEIDNTFYILAKERLSVIKNEYKTIAEYDSKDLIGKSYEPVFDYYIKDIKLKNKENGWKVYGAEFVTTDSGTGIVHIAPAFGSDDYDLSIKNNLPFIQHVTTSGMFKSEVKDFAGQQVKPKDTVDEKDAHQKADVEVIKYIAKNGTLFAKEKIIHSYPHCWRCDTPLLNYATSSWFVRVTSFKDKLVKENKKIKWTPPEVGEGRFGNWLEGARDWAISRSRFWGAPLPVWKDEKTNECYVIGSVEELRKMSKPKNKYYVCRHGEADNNVNGVVSSLETNPDRLTANGRKQALDASKWLKEKKIDLILVSPFIRTRETAEIISKQLGLNKDQVLVEERLHELNAGIWNGKYFAEYSKHFANTDRFVETPEGGENYADIKKRVGELIYDLENKHTGKNILLISHDTPIFLLYAVAKGLDRKQAHTLRGTAEHFINNGEPKALDFHPLPHNAEYELDLHRPFIDDIDLVNEKGNILKRVPEVFDCWFESGSMPFGEAHYPFSKDEFNPKPGPFSKILGKTKGYPADFIAEGLDQTRGWFYSMLVLGVGLFGKTPYKNVTVNGLVLAEDGQKMSKSKKNYPDLMLVVNKFGADALRYVLVSSPVVRAQDFLFSERLVDEVVKKHIGRLNNVVSFYEMYAIPEKGEKVEVKSLNPLDIWINNRLSELTMDITNGLEKYEIDKAARPIAEFIDDLSTWYIRRSRDRFKVDSAGEVLQDKTFALSTTRNVLIDFAKLIAPFMPFLAEDVYMRLKGPLESVHLESWPLNTKIDKDVLEDMVNARKLTSLAMEARMKAKINVRQPLARLTIKSTFPESLIEIIKDEVNVKEVVSDGTINEEVVLDINLTPQLKEEGVVREFIRAIQDLRKEKGLTIKDRVVLAIDADKAVVDLINKNKSTIISTTLLSEIIFKTLLTEPQNIGEWTAKLDIEG